MAQPDAIEIYTVTFLRCGELFLLLQRSSQKSFAPLRWTGLGGHVEANELYSIRSSALREVWEEAGIAEKDITHFALRRALLTNRPGSSLGVIFYFTGLLHEPVQPSCPEGDLFWLTANEFEKIDIIETTRPVLTCLVEDMQTDPQGNRMVITGLGVFDEKGIFQGAIWGNSSFFA